MRVKKKMRSGAQCEPAFFVLKIYEQFNQRSTGSIF
jgi:hypothetical protein